MQQAWDELSQIAAAAASLYRHRPAAGTTAMAVGLHMAQRQLRLELWAREDALDPALPESITNRAGQLQI